MSERGTRNPAASIQQRLLNRARETGEDFQVTLNNFPFEGATLARAIGATFERRKTPFPVSTPEGLTDAYWDHQGRDAQIHAFARRTRVRVDMQAARSLLPLLRQFLLPPLAAARSAQPFNQQWAPGGPWEK